MPHTLRATLVLLAAGIVLSACQEARPETVYVCPPCAPHDTLRFEEDGTCPVCGMELIEKADASRAGQVHLHEGSGSFVLEGGPGHRDDLVPVYYHRPASFTPESPILLVIPGAGRDAWDYRDAWVDAAERHGVLVLSPTYPETNYGFEDYHLGGVVATSNVLEIAEFVEDSHQVRLHEERLSYEVEPDRETWIFNDFDRIFERAASAVGSERTSYDVFGHSAGGQILHRMVLFHPDTKADRIVAANSGFYTLPDPGTKLPFGLEDAPVAGEDLRASFRQELVLLLGQQDDGPEAGGTFLRSASADAQGPGRLQRGRHFWETGRAEAHEMGAEFRWELETVPGVGHDGDAMSGAAAAYLYGGEEAG